MRFMLPVTIMTTLTVMLWADTTSAGIFRRLWERRNAEISSELSAELGQCFPQM